MDITPGRRVTLALSVPVALALIGWCALSAVAAVGTGQYTFDTPLSVSHGTLTVNSPGSDITVAPGPTARLSGTLTYSLIRPVLTLTASGVSARCELPTGDCDLNATLTVPSSASTVDISTDGGDLTVNAGVASDLNLSTSGGDITANGLTRTARLDAEGGDINATGITAADITARSEGGDITLTFSAVPRDVQVNSEGGNISIVVPRAGYQIDASANIGGVSAPASDPGSPDVISATADGGDVTISES
jgi:hypothetical protein